MATELCYYFAFIGVRERLTRPMPSGVRRSARSIVIALLQHRLYASRIAGACAWQRQKAEAQPRNAATGTMSDKMKSNYRIQGATGDWEVVIGLEVHARSEEHTSELQSLMRSSYAVLCLKKKKKKQRHITQRHTKT